MSGGGLRLVRRRVACAHTWNSELKWSLHICGASAWRVLIWQHCARPCGTGAATCQLLALTRLMQSRVSERLGIVAKWRLEIADLECAARRLRSSELGGELGDFPTRSRKSGKAQNSKTGGRGGDAPLNQSLQSVSSQYAALGK